MSNRGILELIPHRSPFVFVDEVIEIDNEDGITQKKITDDLKNYVSGAAYSTSFFIEIMAQSVAAINGAKSKGQEAKIGYLIACKKLNVKRWANPGETIETHAKKIGNLGNMSMYKCSCFIGDELIASAKLSFFIEE